MDRQSFAGFGRGGSPPNYNWYQNSIAYTYDAASVLRTAADMISGTITRTYDGLDPLKTETTAQGLITYWYDTAGRCTQSQVSGADRPGLWLRRRRPAALDHPEDDGHGLRLRQRRSTHRASNERRAPCRRDGPRARGTKRTGEGWPHPSRSRKLERPTSSNRRVTRPRGHPDTDQSRARLGRSGAG